MTDLSPKDAARALGVSESSIRRWVDGGALPCQRTAGGHRRLRRADLIAYAREQGLSLRQDAATAVASASSGERDRVEALTEALISADQNAAEALVLGPHTEGQKLGELFDELIAPAMARIGALWQGGEEGVLEEHRATAATSRMIRHLRDQHPTHEGPAAVGGAIEGDPFSLPSQMTDAILTGLGYVALDLGPNTPVKVIGRAASEAAAKLAWISVNHVTDPVSVRSNLLSTLDAHAKSVTTFILGGRALAALDLPKMAHVHQLRSMQELEAVAALS